MRKEIIAGLLSLAAFVAVGTGTTSAYASAVKINGTTVNRQFLNTNNYYQTKRATKVHLEYAQIGSDKGYTKSVTLPKGTIVGGQLGKSNTTGKMNAQLDFMGGQLNYALVNKSVKKGYLADGDGYSTAISSFKKISTPAYLPTWSYGDLYLGGTSVAKQYRAVYPSQSVQITTNGYVEVHKKGSVKSWMDYYLNKPIASVKIKKTTTKGNTRYLYLSSALKGFKTTRVGKKGAYEYRLIMTNLHKPVTIPSHDEDSDVSSFVSLYSLGGVTYYTPIGVSGDAD